MLIGYTNRFKHYKKHISDSKASDVENKILSELVSESDNLKESKDNLKGIFNQVINLRASADASSEDALCMIRLRTSLIVYSETFLVCLIRPCVGWYSVVKRFSCVVNVSLPANRVRVSAALCRALRALVGFSNVVDREVPACLRTALVYFWCGSEYMLWVACGKLTVSVFFLRKLKQFA